MGQYFLGTNTCTTEKPEQLIAKNVEVKGRIETPSTYSKRVHFPWTDGINRDIGLPSTVITPELVVFMMGEAFTEINNFIKNLETITEKVKKVLRCVSPIINGNSSNSVSKNGVINYSNINEKQILKTVAEGTTSNGGK